MLSDNTADRAFFDGAGINQEFIVSDGRFFVVDLDPGYINPVAGLGHGYIIKTHILQEFVTRKFQIVKVIRIVHMAVAVALVAADFNITFTDHNIYFIMITIMFQYCPSCASKKIQFNGRRFHCPDCGFVYYHNVAAATGCVIQAGEKVLLLVRGKEPALGKLDLPGGFVDPGEGVLEGLCRELREELGWLPPLEAGTANAFTLFASFPNTYPYKNIEYTTCDMFFTVSAPGLTEQDLRIEAGEITGVRFLRPDEIKDEDLAFDSTRRAMEAFRKHYGQA